MKKFIRGNTAVLALFTFSILSYVLLVPMFSGSINSAIAAEKANYLMGSTRSTSGTYPAAVAGAGILNKYAPDVQVTLIATGATHDNLKRLRLGDLQWAMVTNPDGAAMSYAGVRKYKTPDKTLRLFFYYLTNITHILVREDTDIHKLEDLNGRIFHAGGIGFASTYNTKAIFKALGIKPKWFIGSLSDAVAAIKDNRCRGYSKSGAGIGSIDSTTMDILTRTKMRIVSFTDKQVKVALKTIPGLFYGLEPAGSIKGMENQGNIRSFANGLASYGNTKIPQEIGYQMIKAIVEHYDDIIAASPKSAKVNPIKDTIKHGVATAKMCGLPLHAGVVQYFEERGEKVPALIIPPEYKKK